MKRLDVGDFEYAVLKFFILGTQILYMRHWKLECKANNVIV
jgi:hypothetical protein